MARDSRRASGGVRSLHATALELPWPSGEIPLRGGIARFVVRRSQGGISHVEFHGEDGPPEAAAVARWLERAGAPVVAGPGGAAGLWEAAAGAEPRGWPKPPRAEATGRGGEGGLAISRASVRALRSGHPWVLADADTGPIEGFAPGALVRLEGPGGRPVGLARIDDGRPVVARLWSAEAVRPREAPSIEARVARALARRAPVLAEEGANGAVRLVHGEADGLPGLVVDQLAGGLRLLVSARCALPLRARVLSALSAREAPRFVVEVIHLRHAPPGRLTCVRRLAAGEGAPAEALPEDAGGPLVVEEDGLRFAIDPGLAEPHRPRPGVGFFHDQRLARREARRRVQAGGHYLNLFAHTGAFSASLLAAGAGSVTSVDLSAAYLDRLEANLALCHLDGGRHRRVQRDVRRFLAELGSERFHGIVLDPPTAAAAGRRFLATRRELAELVAACLGRLRPGGWLYVSRNDRRRRGHLRELVEEAARSAGAAPLRLHPGAVPPDFPELAGFPEGAPFEACWALRAARGGGSAPSVRSRKVFQRRDDTSPLSNATYR